MKLLDLLVRYADLVATTVLVGGLAYAVLVEAPERRGRRALRSATWLLAAALFLELGLNALRMHRISGIGGMTLLSDVMGMKWSRWWILRGLALAAIAGGLAIDGPRWSWLAGIGVISLGGRSFQGHAGAHGTTAAVFDWVHLCAAAIWVGGLVQLALASRVPPAKAVRASRVFTTALGPLVVAGLYGAFLQVTALGLLITSPYGRVLLAKITLAALWLGLAAANHFRHVPALARGGESPTALMSTVRTEILVAAVVLMLSAMLVSLPMPHPPEPR